MKSPFKTLKLSVQYMTDVQFENFIEEASSSFEPEEILTLINLRNKVREEDEKFNKKLRDILNFEMSIKNIDILLEKAKKLKFASVKLKYVSLLLNYRKIIENL